MCEPVYEQLVTELGDPETVQRDVDTWLIRWHADRMRRERGEAGGPPQPYPSP